MDIALSFLAVVAVFSLKVALLVFVENEQFQLRKYW